MSLSSEHHDWITSKADCSLPQVFQDLKGILEKDVEIAKKKSPWVKNGNEFSFSFHHRTANEYFIERCPPAQSMGLKYRRVRLTLTSDAITIEKLDFLGQPGEDPPQPIGTVTSAWDSSTGTCDLLLNEKPCVYWQISHAALDPIVF